MTFASELDARLFAAGPPALFTLDPKGRLRVDPERTREIYLLVGVPEGREEGHYVLTDAVTGLKLYLLVSHPALACAQPRGTVERFPDHESAVAEAVKQWRMAPAEASTDLEADGQEP